ncbi:MAG: transposase [Collinsella sp.]|nr:transposase [Collinsella sp.]
MPKYSTAFGMDVHLRSTTVCALDADTGEAVTRRFPGNPWGEIAGWMDGFPGPSLAAYESGYLGFAPQRELAGLGVECVVAAVSKIPRSAADSASKNDRNDAARMAKAILAHDISPVWVPSPEVGGIRDLAGAYDGATARLATAKQRLLAFLARRGFVYGGTTPAGNPRKYWTYDGGGRPPVDQGLRLRAGRGLLGRGRRLHEVPFRKAGHGLFRPRAESEVEWRLRAARRHQRCGQRAREEAGR